MALKEVFNGSRVLLATAAATGFLFSTTAKADVEWTGAAGDERLVVTPGQTMTVADGATLDLSDVTEVALKDASAPVPADGWVIAASVSGGIVPAEARRLTWDLSGYVLFVTAKQARIGKYGFVISFH